MGTAVLAPRPSDPLRPALRVYGLFADKREAVEHADAVRAADPRCSLCTVDAHEWILMPQCTEARDDPEEAGRRVARRLGAHDEARRSRDEAFDRMVAAHAEPPRIGPEEAARNVALEEDEETEEAEALVYGRPARLRSGAAEVRGQRAVALCVLPDPVGGECLFKVLACFETSADAECWVRNVATRTIVTDDVLVAPTCEWLYPNAMRSRPARTHYRVEELQRIVDAVDKRPAQIRRYKDDVRQFAAARAADCDGAAAGGDRGGAHAQTEDTTPPTDAAADAGPSE